MRKGRLAVAIGTAAVVVTTLGTAVAGPAAPIVVSRNAQPTKPQLLVDSKGTVNIVWLGVKQTSTGGENVVHYARKTKSSKKFTSVGLPHGGLNVSDPFLFQASPGVLVIASEYNDEDIIGFRSANDGKSWTLMNTSAINSEIGNSTGVYLYSQELTDAPGGPIAYTGNDGTTGPIDQLNPSLTAFHQIGTNDGSFLAIQLALATNHTLFQIGAGAAYNQVNYQAGAHTGTINFPSCVVSANHGALAAGTSNAVVVETGCGHVWSHTISATGAVGPLKLISHGQVSAASTFNPWAQVVTDRTGHFTVVFAREGGDLGVAHSSNGSSWSTSSKSVPVAGVVAPYARNQVVSSGVSTWYAEAGENTNPPYADVIRATPLSDTYQPPAFPSGHGFSHPKRARLGSLAVTVPGAIPLKHFRDTGKLVVRMVGAIADKETVDVRDTRTKGTTTTYYAQGELASSPIKPGHVKTVTIQCSGGGIVIGGTAAAGVNVHKGDDVTFTFSGRDGQLVVTAKVA